MDWANMGDDDDDSYETESDHSDETETDDSYDTDTDHFYEPDTDDSYDTETDGSYEPETDHSTETDEKDGLVPTPLGTVTVVARDQTFAKRATLRKWVKKCLEKVQKTCEVVATREIEMKEFGKFECEVSLVRELPSVELGQRFRAAFLANNWSKVAVYFSLSPIFKLEAKRESFIQEVEKYKDEVSAARKIMKKIDEVIAAVDKVDGCATTAKVVGKAQNDPENLRRMKESWDKGGKEFAKICDEFIRCALELDVSKTNSFTKEIGELKRQFGVEFDTFEKHLPIFSYRSKILKAIDKHQVTVLVAETGSGKSTEIVKYLLRKANRGLIACTQPRKVAATSLAEYVSKSLGKAIGTTVGYDLGFRKRFQPAQTKIVYMTDNSLLAALNEDPALNNFEYVVVDEAHERSLPTDLLVSLLKEAILNTRRRYPLKVIITSATMDHEIFCEFFKGFSVKKLNIPGKIFPIEVVWSESSIDVTSDYVKKAVDKVLEVLAKRIKGGILAFLATPAETERAKRLLLQRVDQKINNVLLLHGKLPLEELQKVFQTRRDTRKIVFATNAAETSITIPDIMIVIDAGVAKERSFDPKSNVGTLSLKEISRSSARQRMGRAGRTASGMCFRLYTEEDYQKFQATTLPEIKRLPLDQCLLRILSFGKTDPTSFDFLDPPSRDAIRKGLETLMYLEAIEEIQEGDYSLTDLGRKMTHFGIDPRLSKLLLEVIDGSEEGDEKDYLCEVIYLCAILANGGNIFFRQGTDEEKEKSDIKKTRFCDKASDFLTMLHVYVEWYSRPESERSKWCSENAINGKSMGAISMTVQELRGIIKALFRRHVDLKDAIRRGFAENVLPLLTRCLGLNLAVFSGHKKQGYVAVRSGDLLHLHPSCSISHLGEDLPRFVVFEQVLITSQAFMIHVGQVEENDRMVEEYAQRLSSIMIRRHFVSYFEIQSIGDIVMKRYFIGGRFCKKLALEQELTNLVSHDEGKAFATSFVELTCDVDAGTITCFCHERYQKLLCDVIQSHLDKVRKKLREETWMVRATTNASFFLRNGGTVVEPFLAHDFIAICIKQPFRQAVIQEQLAEAFFFVYHKIKFLGDGCCFVEFTQASEAKKAYDVLCSKELLNKLQLDLQQVVPKRRPEQSDILANMTMKLEIVRRARTNYAFLDFKNDIAAAKFLAKNCCRFCAKISRNNTTSVMLVPISSVWTKEKLRPHVPEDTYGKVVIKLPRKKSFKSSASQLERLRENIIDVLRDRCLVPTQLFHVREINSKDHHTHWQVFIDFRTIESGLKVYGKDWEEMSVTDGIGEYLCESVDYWIKTKFSVASEVYDLLGEELEELCGHDIKLSVGKKLMGRVSLELDFQTDDLEAISAKHVDVVDLISGHTVYHENLRLFENQENWTKLVEALEEVGVVAKKNVVRALPSITLFGSRAYLTKAELLVNLMVGDIMDETQGFLTVPLRGDNVPRGTIRRLIEEFGIELQGFKKIPGIVTAKLRFKGRATLEITGTAEACRKLGHRISSLLATLKCGAESEEETCSICFTSPPKKDVYRLQVCGHLLCKSCFCCHISVGELPLLCPEEDCEEMVCILDLKTMLEDEARSEMKKKFLTTSINHFMAHNDAFAFCPTPDCEGIFPVFDAEVPDSKLVFHCLDCKANICTRCKVRYHEGYHCEKYQALYSRRRTAWSSFGSRGVR